MRTVIFLAFLLMLGCSQAAHHHKEIRRAAEGTPYENCNSCHMKEMCKKCHGNLFSHR